jgi:prepilin-type N-terminal cleavage/methylation domain-containing protein
VGRAYQKGFSLVELSIVILIMGLLLSAVMMPMSVQRDNAKLRESDQLLRTARSAIGGFLLVNGFLPCPATPASGGLSVAAGGTCALQHGFLPATTLSLDGQRNLDNLLLDPWGSPLRYSVSASDVDANGAWDFVTAGEMQNIGMAGLRPELTVCSTSVGSTATDCAGVNVTLTRQAPLVIYSLGKDWSSFSSADQVENVGAVVGGGPSGSRYRVAVNSVFVVRGGSTLSGSEFDDRVLWMAANRLYGKLVAVGHLP